MERNARSALLPKTNLFREVLRRPLESAPYASDDYIAEVEKWGIVRSMSRNGDRWDNAIAECFFSTLEFECARGTAFETRQSLTTVLGDYIDDFTIQNACTRRSAT